MGRVGSLPASKVDHVTPLPTKLKKYTKYIHLYIIFIYRLSFVSMLCKTTLDAHNAESSRAKDF